MISIRVAATIAALASSVLVGPRGADAATLTGVGLMADTGNGYHNVELQMELVPGNSVIANPGGVGEIRYADGCIQKVNPGDVVVVKELSPCAAGNSGTAGSANMLIVGGVVVAGVVVGAVALSGGGNDKPKSP